MSPRDFPWLDAHQYYPFPPVESADPQGIVAMGGNLSPGMLISAYSQGIFPWYGQGEPILWWSLDPRFLLFPEELHISGSMKKLFKKRPFRYSMDRAFLQVIRLCGETKRPGQRDTWITGEMIEAYVDLHRLGLAHSVEVWQQDNLVAGLYGISLGKCFFGESMFSRINNGSKAAFILFTRLLQRWGFPFIDCQQPTSHLASLGAREVPRSFFIDQLNDVLNHETLQGSWQSQGEFLEEIQEEIIA
ncbi:MAG: leucyl/phenylalanyl-tRNA--protein transferase [Spirochaetaceae bacterium]|jgi:leucyl/phenylalanyl-tRNA--protein transferase|nr:leucyl/phenylalanyl-tRNA--protein transferase [Spirochaetaceae bacterium]